MPGPLPKRDAERRRRNKPDVATVKVDLDVTLASEVEIPAMPMTAYDGDGDLLDEPVPTWHPTAVAWYTSLTRSGQAIFYEQSDWATAYILAEQLSLSMEPRPIQIGVDADGKPEYRSMVMPMNGASMTAFLKGAAALMATEGDRRRLRIELDRKSRRDAIVSEEGKVADIASKRSDVFARRARG